MTSRLPRMAKVFGVAGIAVGLIVMAGWAADVPALTRPLGGLAMKFNAAFTVILTGAALVALADGRASARQRRAGQALAIVVLAISGLTLAQYVFGVDLSIDQLLFPEPPSGRGALRPGRMAPSTALA